PGAFTGNSDRSTSTGAGATSGGAAPSTPTTINTPGAAAAGARGVPSPSAPPAPVTGTESTSLSVQLRDLLDPSTLAEIRRLETSRAPGASAEALERAAAALRARAARLQEQSQELRARAHGSR